MRNRFIWLTLSIITVALLLAACQQQAATPTGGTEVVGKVSGTTAPTTSGTTPATTGAPATSVAPSPTSAQEMVLDPATHKMVPKPEYGGTLTYVTGTGPPYIDPWNGSSGVGPASFFLEKLATANWAVDRNIFPWISTSYFPSSIYRGQLAESWDVISGTDWIIHIRKGVLWQNLPPMNGRELTASDVKFSYDRTCGTGSGFTKPTPNATGMLGIPFDSFTVIDKYTLEVKLKAPMVTALKIFLCESYEGSWVYPPEVIQKYGNLNDWRTVVGTGPFMISDHVVDSSWTWAKNPVYWGYDEKFPQNKIPYVDKVRLLVIPDVQTQIAALRAGKIVYLGADIPTSKTLRKSNPELQEFRYFSTAQAYPIDATQAPMNDVRVRTALQQAINMKEISDTFYEGLADPTPVGQTGTACVGYNLPYSQWKDDWKASYAFNLDSAKDLMKQAGYPNGFKTTFNHYAAWVNSDVLQIVQGYWQKIGVTLDVKTYDWASYSNKVFAKAAGPLGSWYACVNYEPMAWIKVQFYSKNPWSFPVGDPAYDALVDKADAAPTEQEQMKLVLDCEAYAIPKHWMIVIPRAPSFGFAQPWYHGFNGEGYMGGGEASSLYARYWIDQDLKFKMTGIKE